MEVIATAVGFDGVCLRQPAEVFEMPDGSTGTWFKPVSASKAKASKAKGDSNPKTLSEVARAIDTSGTPADLV